MQDSQKIRRAVYSASAASMFFFSASSIILPISLVKISSELGLSLTQAGTLGFVAAMIQLLQLLASSWLAAWQGKIRIIRLGLLIMAGGLALFSGSSSFASALFRIILIGLGAGVLEALLTPIVEDLYPEDDGGKMNLLHAFWPVGTCVAVLLFGWLLSAEVDWRWLYLGLGAAIALVAFLYPSSHRMDLPRSRSDFSHLKEIFSFGRFWLFGFGLAFAGGAEAAFAFWSASYIQINFAALPFAGGIGTASFAVGMALGRFASSSLAGKWGLRKLLLLSLVAALACSFGFFFINALIALYAFLLVMGLTIACLWPSLQSFAARRIPVDRTVLMILLSCFGVPGFSSATLFMGMLGDSYGLRVSFIVAPVYLAVALALLLVEGRLRPEASVEAHS